MKLRLKNWLSLLCAVVLAVGLIPVADFTATAEMGGDFPWTDSKEPMLIEQILERDGFIDGIWFPWFNAGQGGHNLTGNDLMAKYYNSNSNEDWARVELDYIGADKIYQQIYNLKAMGYNVMAYGGSIYGEGVIFNDSGNVVGIKEEYLNNARRLLDMCREIGMPVMWNVYFHCSSMPNYNGVDGWKVVCQMLGNQEVARNYAKNFVAPLCEMLAEYPDVVALVSIADEPENEINDSSLGESAHFEGDRAMYGVTQADMVYFMKQINDTVREKLPNVARTVASNNQNKAIYRDFDLDLMGHNRYSDAVGSFPSVSRLVTDADPILTEYNLGWKKQTDDKYTEMHIGFREEMVEKGYKGGFSWCWMPDRGDNDDGASYYLIRSRYDVTSFRKCVTDLRHYMDEYRAEYRGEKLGFTAPVMYANYGSTGKVLFIPSKDAVSYTVQRSDDGGKSWKDLTVKSTTLVDQYLVGRYTDSDSTRPKSGYCYRVIAYDKNGKSVTSKPNYPAGTDTAYKKTFVKPEYIAGKYVVSTPYSNLNSTTSLSNAMDVYLEAASGGYYLYTVNGSAKQYMNLEYNNGSFVNVIYEATPSTVYTYDSINKTLVGGLGAKFTKANYRFESQCFVAEKGTSKEKSYYMVTPVTKNSCKAYCRFYTVSSGTAKAVDTPVAGQAYKFGAVTEDAPTGKNAEMRYLAAGTAGVPSVKAAQDAAEDTTTLISFGETYNRPLNPLNNLINNSSFEKTSGGQWNNRTFLNQYVQVVDDSTAPDGEKSLKFDTSATQEEGWYTFTVTGLAKDSDYVLSTWIKGDYLKSSNKGMASFGVIDPDTGKFMTFYEYCRGSARSSRATQQIYPPAWDKDWHLRSVRFTTGNNSSMTFALYGYGSVMWLDDIALYKNGQGTQYTDGTSDEMDVDFVWEDVTCDPRDSLVEDVTVDDKAYWTSGSGWRNGFMSFHESRVQYGYALKYTASKDPHGVYYLKSIPVKKNTTYYIAFDVKILKDGAGRVVLMDNQKDHPAEVYSAYLDSDTYGTGWFHHNTKFYSGVYDQVNFGVIDLGGSALIDNVRIFKLADENNDVKDLKTSSVKTVNNVAYGKTASVEARATGDGLKYQWYFKDKGASKFSLTTSFKTKTYSAAMNASRDGRQVYCVITDKYGVSRQTATTTLTVKRSNAKITTQPKTGYAQLNKTAKVTVKATGDGLKYTWYIKNAGATKYSKSSVTSSTYSVKMTEKVHGRRVYCVVSDVWGNTVQSNTVLLRRAASIVTQPKTVTVAKNKTAKVTVKAAGDGLKYTWYIKNAGSSKYTKSSNTKSTYSVKMTSKVNGRYVYCVVTDKYGKTVKTSTVRVKMK